MSPRLPILKEEGFVQLLLEEEIEDFELTEHYFYSMVKVNGI